jgi:thiamine transporter ThiT
MYDKELEEKIINYGKLSFNNGYKDGFFTGLVTGCLITLMGVLGGKILLK